MITNNVINHYLSQYIFLINIKYYDLIILKLGVFIGVINLKFKLLHVYNF